jgi:hypothetical protein
MTRYQDDGFRGIRETYRNLGSGCHLWTPTEDYKRWLREKYPAKSWEEMVRLGWVKEARKRKSGVSSNEGLLRPAR